jgi:hypothetical protein
MDMKTAQGTGLKGEPVETIIARFFGEIGRWPINGDGHNWTQPQIRAIAKHMSETGDCLWHAMYVTTGIGPCHCANCTK